MWWFGSGAIGEGHVCGEYVGNGFEEMKRSCRQLQGEGGVCCCSRGKNVFFIAR